eukprot:scaffold59752_cov63-Phaeocystis_antarctica.AAC.3
MRLSKRATARPAAMQTAKTAVTQRESQGKSDRCAASPVPGCAAHDSPNHPTLAETYGPIPLG